MPPPSGGAGALPAPGGDAVSDDVRRYLEVVHQELGHITEGLHLDADRIREQVVQEVVQQIEEERHQWRGMVGSMTDILERQQHDVNALRARVDQLAFQTDSASGGGGSPMSHEAYSTIRVELDALRAQQADHSAFLRGDVEQLKGQASALEAAVVGMRCELSAVREEQEHRSGGSEGLVRGLVDEVAEMRERMRAQAEREQDAEELYRAMMQSADDIARVMQDLSASMAESESKLRMEIAQARSASEEASVRRTREILEAFGESSTHLAQSIVDERDTRMQEVHELRDGLEGMGNQIGQCWDALETALAAPPGKATGEEALASLREELDRLAKDVKAQLSAAAAQRGAEAADAQAEASATREAVDGLGERLAVLERRPPVEGAEAGLAARLATAEAELRRISAGDSAGRTEAAAAVERLAQRVEAAEAEVRRLAGGEAALGERLFGAEGALQRLSAGDGLALLSERLAAAEAEVQRIAAQEGRVAAAEAEVRRSAEALAALGDRVAMAERGGGLEGAGEAQTAIAAAARQALERFGERMGQAEAELQGLRGAGAAVAERVRAAEAELNARVQFSDLERLEVEAQQIKHHVDAYMQRGESGLQVVRAEVSALGARIAAAEVGAALAPTRARAALDAGLERREDKRDDLKTGLKSLVEKMNSVLANSRGGPEARGRGAPGSRLAPPAPYYQKDRQSDEEHPVLTASSWKESSAPERGSTPGATPVGTSDRTKAAVVTPLATSDRAGGAEWGGATAPAVGRGVAAVPPADSGLLPMPRSADASIPASVQRATSWTPPANAVRPPAAGASALERVPGEAVATAPIAPVEPWRPGQRFSPRVAPERIVQRFATASGAVQAPPSSPQSSAVGGPRISTQPSAGYPEGSSGGYSAAPTPVGTETGSVAQGRPSATPTPVSTDHGRGNAAVVRRAAAATSSGSSCAVAASTRVLHRLQSPMGIPMAGAPSGAAAAARQRSPQQGPVMVPMGRGGAGSVAIGQSRQVVVKHQPAARGPAPAGDHATGAASQ